MDKLSKREEEGADDQEEEGETGSYAALDGEANLLNCSDMQ